MLPREVGVPPFFCNMCGDLSCIECTYPKDLWVYAEFMRHHENGWIPKFRRETTGKSSNWSWQKQVVWVKNGIINSNIWLRKSSWNSHQSSPFLDAWKDITYITQLNDFGDDLPMVESKQHSSSPQRNPKSLGDFPITAICLETQLTQNLNHQNPPWLLMSPGICWVQTSPTYFLQKCKTKAKCQHGIWSYLATLHLCKNPSACRSSIFSLQGPQGIQKLAETPCLTAQQLPWIWKSWDFHFLFETPRKLQILVVKPWELKKQLKPRWTKTSYDM